ncbi:4'-phosphopantetheinyl transferase superfamily protein [Mesorhizobium sp. VK22B]|uniref:4'-phosphopantetheinyl transferase superfamily protein n=1 Tax=Mesorhizobium captivum TaxID=3072319 RepID=A0ABU4Z1E5_9HYPH|nr:MULTISPECIES: 4'-phosphopantetheinyl transferase superfamily protein [unclassified Mesorhizobium]MDX8493052.1 4'-phosphopantetheinyl transferase superfamily protein [Mesorhizobium sp. VK22B]MDX8507702.1 4'-phosphopantetheinyl transferase superfamily protein [Mesorhizobium sp. VK22E]
MKGVAIFVRMSAPSERDPRMTSDRCPVLDFPICWCGRGRIGCELELSCCLGGTSINANPRFGFSRPFVEPAPPHPDFLDKVEQRPGIIIPVLDNDGLEVLVFMLDAEQNVVHEIGVCLNEGERRRADKLRLERDRRRFEATRRLLRGVLASRLGISPSDVELEYGHTGKPHLSHRMPARDLRFSLSRSGDVAVVALAIRQEVGVDIEAVLPVPEADEIAALCFRASEYRSYSALSPQDRLDGFLRRWTRLEAISKALGCGLGQPPSWQEADWAIHSFVPKPGYIGTVVVRN